jgi:hypothetical protein
VLQISVASFSVNGCSAVLICCINGLTMGDLGQQMTCECVADLDQLCESVADLV